MKNLYVYVKLSYIEVIRKYFLERRYSMKYAWLTLIVHNLPLGLRPDYFNETRTLHIHLRESIWNSHTRMNVPDESLAFIIKTVLTRRRLYSSKLISMRYKEIYRTDFTTLSHCLVYSWYLRYLRRTKNRIALCVDSNFCVLCLFYYPFILTYSSSRYIW